jgi:hypothetical protein
MTENDLEDFDDRIEPLDLNDPDPTPTPQHPYRIGDPVIDLAQGRPMVVVGTPRQDVSDWSEANDYDLVDNYANSKFDPKLSEPVVECCYVGDIRSEPSKTYTFPVSRCKLIDVHHADDGPRLADRAIVEFAEDLLEIAADDESLPAVGRLSATIQRALYDDSDIADRLAEISESLQARQGGDE